MSYKAYGIFSKKYFAVKSQVPGRCQVWDSGFFTWEMFSGNPLYHSRPDGASSSYTKNLKSSMNCDLTTKVMYRMIKPAHHPGDCRD